MRSTSPAVLLFASISLLLPGLAPGQETVVQLQPSSDASGGRADLEAALTEIDATLAEVDWMLGTIEATGSLEQIDIQPTQLAARTWNARLALSAGTESNVLLEDEGEVQSAYLRSAVDLFGEGSLGDSSRWELVAFYEGRLFEEDSLPGENLLFTNLSWLRAAGAWETQLGALYSFSEYIYEDSLINGSLTTAFLREQSGSFLLGTEYMSAGGHTVGAKLEAGASRFGDSALDFDFAHWRVEGSWIGGQSWRIQPWLGLERRFYLERPERDPRGTARSDLLRSTVWQGGLWASWKFAADWSWSTSLAVEAVRDDGGRYYDRDRGYVAPRLVWSPGDWEFALAGSVQWIDYKTRRLYPYIVDARTQWQRRWSAGFEVRRAWGMDWETSIEFKREVLDSNLEEAAYTTWRGELGCAYLF